MGFKKSRKILGLDFGKCRDWDFEKIPRSMDIPLVGPGTESWSMSIRTFVFLPFWLSSSYSLLEFVRTPSQARGGICHCRRQCKIFASGVNFTTHFLCFFLLKLLELGKIDGKIFSLKIRRCKFFDKFHVCLRRLKFIQRLFERIVMVIIGLLREPAKY